MIRPRTSLLAAASLLVMSCGREPVVPGDDESALPLGDISVSRAGATAPIELRILSVAGSYEMVEPDVVRVPGGFRGFEYWMAVNPYPSGDDIEENASIYASHDGLAWETPAGLVNPVIPRPAGEVRHNSDPDLVYLEDPARLVLFDRAVSHTQNLLRQ